MAKDYVTFGYGKEGKVRVREGGSGRIKEEYGSAKEYGKAHSKRKFLKW